MKSLFMIFALLVVNITFSQKKDEHSVWLSAELNYKPNKKWNIGIQEQLRLKENASITDSYFTQIEVSYRIVKNLDVSAGYRYIKLNDNKGAIQGYNDFGRLQFDLYYGHKLGSFAVKYRARYQTKNQLGIVDESKDNIRFKVSIGYDIKGWKLDPKFSAEIYDRIGATNKAKNGFKKYRYTFGTAYKTKNSGKFGIFYRIEKHLNTKKPVNNYIIGLNYSYTFKK